MKKGIYIIVIALAMVHIGGFTPFYVAALEEVKKEAELELGITANLVKVVVTAAEMKDASVFKQHEEGEFSYRGKMYDYKVAEVANGTRIFYAVKDDKESALLDCLKSLFGNENGREGKGPLSKLLKNFSKDYLLEQTVTMHTEYARFSDGPVTTDGYLSSGFADRVSYPPDLRG